MFTGIVEGVGSITTLAQKGSGVSLTVSVPFDLASDNVGDSIAINGICLTAVTLDRHAFTAHVSAETLSRTNLGRLKSGDKVNVERALRLGDRLGGHMVTGHIDGTGRFSRRETRGESVYLEIEADESILLYVVEKGSIAVDGVSLTVNGVGADFFALNIIPHTLEVTTLGQRQTGESVNLETDIIGRYVARLLGKQSARTGVDMTLLEKCGFI